MKRKRIQSRSTRIIETKKVATAKQIETAKRRVRNIKRLTTRNQFRMVKDLALIHFQSGPMTAQKRERLAKMRMEGFSQFPRVRLIIDKKVAQSVFTGTRTTWEEVQKLMRTKGAVPNAIDALAKKKGISFDLAKAHFVEKFSKAKTKADWVAEQRMGLYGLKSEHPVYKKAIENANDSFGNSIQIFQGNLDLLIDKILRAEPLK